jgi:hypothetical protein
MPDPRDLTEPLALRDDLLYSGLPAFVGLYTDATKWIVGLATGSFFLLGTLDKESTDGCIRLAAGAAIFVMTAAAACGVRGLQLYTKIGNLLEKHAARRDVEAEFRYSEYRAIRYVSPERKARIAAIEAHIASSNRAYLGMTWLFAIGLVAFLVWGALTLAQRHDSAVHFTATADKTSAVIGVVRDPVTHSECVLVRSSAALQCAHLTPGPR